MWRIVVFLSCFIHFTYCFQAVPTSSIPTNLSISALWDECTKSVYYIDFLTTGEQHSLFRYDDREDITYSAYIDGISAPPSFLLPVKECRKHYNLFLVGLGQIAGLVKWDGRSPVAEFMGPLFDLEVNDPTIVFATGVGGELGRFYGGTFHTTFCSGASNASFYTYTRERGVELLFTGTKTTTGIGFDGTILKQIYQVDTCTGLIAAFDGDSDGNICNGRILMDFGNDYPIGLETDDAGKLYTASYSTGEIYQIDPLTLATQVVGQVPPGVGAVTFGGAESGTLFAIVGSTLINPLTAQIVQRNTGPSVYKLRIPGARGRKYKRLMI